MRTLNKVEQMQYKVGDLNAIIHQLTTEITQLYNTVGHKTSLGSLAFWIKSVYQLRTEITNKEAKKKLLIEYRDLIQRKINKKLQNASSRNFNN